MLELYTKYYFLQIYLYCTDTYRSDILKTALFLIMLLILAILIIVFYFNEKILNLRQQYISLNRQYVNLREKYFKEYGATNNVSVTYNSIKDFKAVTNPNINVYLSPLVTCPIINTITDKTKVSILDEAECNNEVWYYVSLPLTSNVNSKGWIKKSDFSTILNNSYEVVQPN